VRRREIARTGSVLYVHDAKFMSKRLLGWDVGKMGTTNQVTAAKGRHGSVLRQHELTRVLRAVVAAGLRDYEVDPWTGRISVSAGGKSASLPEDALDSWVRTHADTH
jgi:hypothetical protein